MTFFKTPSSTSAATPPTRKPSTGKKEAELTSYSALLDKLESYTTNAIASKENVDRKVLDALLAAINIQVQKEPYSVRKLILEKQLVLPNTISFPPSQVRRLCDDLPLRFHGIKTFGTYKHLFRWWNS